MSKQLTVELPTGSENCKDCNGIEVAVLTAGNGGWSATARHNHKPECPRLKCPHGIHWMEECYQCEMSGDG